MQIEINNYDDIPDYVERGETLVCSIRLELRKVGRKYAVKSFGKSAYRSKQFDTIEEALECIMKVGNI